MKKIERAQGCLLGQLAGDALGSLVEFQSPEQIRRVYPDGVRDMADGGAHDTIAGQPTDDSEMALALARALVFRGSYDAGAAKRAYLDWLRSEPFSCGATITAGLTSEPNLDSQANGALMRISPLGIFGSRFELSQVARWAVQDAELTHPHPICLQVNALFTLAVAQAVATGAEPKELVVDMLEWAQDMDADPLLFRVIKACINEPPRDYLQHQGWVLIAFGNAVWQLLNAPTLEDGIMDTIMRGGDTDTNAAICGALLGAVHGLGAVPERWVKTVLACRPQTGLSGVRRPRPEIYWPVDALKLAERLLSTP
ncbi:ADP-ribosylglycohydrolase family protein [Desulfonatronum sp. SC1]|uniref:ADP-ribosylglycohydrolase family protein n=1 Tax=Desulfonatronum sp. SC1 TaxID=2109626 RepID=UPI000D321D8B|nr:ADP-ribosylglycohydrolase family protein [Desulfonatronum sp. SC1]PTN33967.1 ribosylglycohydrolase [Desulfonatronum sp. SC1]